MEMKENGSRGFNLLQYLITTMVSVIGIFTTIIFFMLTDIKNDQSEFSKESLRMKTVQDINTSAIKDIDTRVKVLEFNYLEYVKNWVDENYLRKPQK